MPRLDVAIHGRFILVKFADLIFISSLPFSSTFPSKKTSKIKGDRENSYYRLRPLSDYNDPC